jgi:hypothetical protein
MRTWRTPVSAAPIVVCLSLLVGGVACTYDTERPEIAEAPTDVEVGAAQAATDVVDAEEVTAAAAREYCTYRVLTAVGDDCGVFAQNALICVDCPSNGTCPGAAGGRSAYRYLTADGEVRCRGEWAKRFKVNDPDDCLDCPPGGNRGFEFAGR